MGAARNLYLHPSSPIAELKKLLPRAQIAFDPGMSPAQSAMLARRSDVVIVFGIRMKGEGFDLADLTLPWGQGAVIEAGADQRRIANGTYRVALGKFAGDFVLTGGAPLTSQLFGR